MDKEFTIKVQHPFTLKFYTHTSKRRGKLFLRRSNNRIPVPIVEEAKQNPPQFRSNLMDFTLRNIMQAREQTKLKFEVVEANAGLRKRKFDLVSK